MASESREGRNRRGRRGGEGGLERLGLCCSSREIAASHAKISP